MKKKRFKKWVEYTLLTINFLAFIMLGSDCYDMGAFIAIHLIAIIIFLINTMLLFKYSDILK